LGGRLRERGVRARLPCVVALLLRASFWGSAPDPGNLIWGLAPYAG
jgi:hypothetical protein